MSEIMSLPHRHLLTGLLDLQSFDYRSYCQFEHLCPSLPVWLFSIFYNISPVFSGDLRRLLSKEVFAVNGCAVLCRTAYPKNVIHLLNLYSKLQKPDNKMNHLKCYQYK